MSEPFKDTNGYLPFTGEQPRGDDGRPLSFFDIQVRDFETNKGKSATSEEIAEMHLRDGY
jgi:hypothetical protein